MSGRPGGLKARWAERQVGRRQGGPKSKWAEGQVGRRARMVTVVKCRRASWYPSVVAEGGAVSLGLAPAASTWPGQDIFLQSTVGQGFLEVGLRPGWACGKGDEGLELDSWKDGGLESLRELRGQEPPEEG